MSSAPQVPHALYLCADGGGTSVTIAIGTKQGGILARGKAGSCNVKTAGALVALSRILQATSEALATMGIVDVIDWGSDPPVLRSRVFEGVWLGCAGINSQEDVDAFATLAAPVLLLQLAPGELRVSNDGHLLASPASLFPHIDSAIVLVAGTGSIGFSFRKVGTGLAQIGQRGGWGYRLGDQGSAYDIGRIAIRSLLLDNDSRESSTLLHPTTPPPPLLPIYASLLAHLNTSSCSNLIERTYSAPSASAGSFLNEASRNVWIAEAARVVFAYAFEEGKDAESKLVAQRIVQEAVQELVDITTTLVADRAVIKPEKTVLSLGGGLWNVVGYRDLLLKELEEKKGIVFRELVRIEDPAEAGLTLLLAQSLV